MVPSASTELDRASALFLQQSYSEALALLVSLPWTEMSTEEQARCLILISHAQINLGNYSEDLLDRATLILSESVEHDLYATARYLKAQCASYRGENKEAAALYSEAHAAYIRCDNKVAVGRCLNQLAFIAQTHGNEQLCYDHYSTAIATLSSLGSRVQLISVQANLAVAFYRHGRIARSIDTHAVIHSEGSTYLTKTMEFNFHLTYGMALALSGDTEAGLAEICKADSVGEESIRRKGQYFEYLGCVHLMRGEYAEAEDALTEGLAIALNIAPHSALVSQIKRLLADLYIETGRFTVAGTTAEESLAVAKGLGQQLEIAASHRALALVALHTGKLGIAREQFRKALELFALINARYELAATRLKAAVSSLYPPHEANALLYLAREYFVSESIVGMIERVDEAMAALAHNTPKVLPVTSTRDQFTGVVASSKSMRKIIELVDRIAPTRMTVLLTGATGTGKDLLAHHIHEVSGRTGNFVSINAPAVPGTLVESELFGYNRGAFTGASNLKPGMFEQAGNGTIFINEIGDSTPEFQAKLLEILETRVVRRLGSSSLAPQVDFRIIAATNANLTELVNQNKFRADLYHRLREVEITLPALDDRKDEIPALVAHHMAEMGADLNSDELARLSTILQKLNWPGNIRQLRHQLTFEWVKCSGYVDEMLRRFEDSFRREQVALAVKHAGGNQRKAARTLGLPESTIRYWLKKDSAGLA